MLNLENLRKIKELVEENDNIVIFHHVNPDGDCLGTSFGLAQLLKDNYPNKNIKVASEIEQWTPGLRYMDNLVNWDEFIINTPEEVHYLGIVTDVCFTPRTFKFEEFERRLKNIIVIDHHENDMNINNVDLFWKEPGYTSASLMITELAIENNWEIKETPALIIAHGMLTDTEVFFSADSLTFEFFSKLLNIFGSEKYSELVQLIKKRSSKLVKFQSQVLSDYKKVDDIAYMIVDQEIIDSYQVNPAEFAKVGLLDNIEGINYWAFFVQYPDYVRMELRSNSEDRRVDLIAKNFGGGGHKQRSGASLKDMSVPEKVIKYILENK